MLAHRTAITLESSHAVDALNEAYENIAKLEIINIGQGSQFTAQEFVDAMPGAITCLLNACGVR
jgi:putative transposase